MVPIHCMGCDPLTPLLLNIYTWLWPAAAAMAVVVDAVSYC
jgi:hypothetical protein